MGTSSFYRCLGPLPPKHLGGKGYHMATKEEAGCTIKGEAMDAGNGRRAASPKLEKPPSIQDDGLALLGLGRPPHGDVALGA